MNKVQLSWVNKKRSHWFVFLFRILLHLYAPTPFFSGKNKNNFFSRDSETLLIEAVPVGQILNAFGEKIKDRTL